MEKGVNYIHILVKQPKIISCLLNKVIEFNTVSVN